MSKIVSIKYDDLKALAEEGGDDLWVKLPTEYLPPNLAGKVMTVRRLFRMLQHGLDVAHARDIDHNAADNSYTMSKVKSQPAMMRKTLMEEGNRLRNQAERRNLRALMYFTAVADATFIAA